MQQFRVGVENDLKAAEQTQPVNRLVGRAATEGALIALVVICTFLTMVLATYDPVDPGWSSTGMNRAIANAGGPFGAWLADVCMSLFGYMAYMFPLLLGWRARLPARPHGTGTVAAQRGNRG